MKPAVKSLLTFLAFPLAAAYGAVTGLRNRLYNSGLRRSTRFTVPVISVGNLSAGGTGKTPHIEYLLRLLNGTYKTAVLSRGYKRKTTGFLQAGPNASAESIGDEPMQFYTKFGSHTVVAVCADRAEAIPRILFENEGTEVILLDDAFQHRRVSPGLNILLTDYAAPFWRDYILPAGMLRESRAGAIRASCIIITKCPPSLSLAEQNQLKQEAARYAAAGTPIFFSGFRYAAPVSLYNPLPLGLNPGQNVLLFAGLARPKPFQHYANETFSVRGSRFFADHYAYSPSDLAQLAAEANQSAPGTALLCTEKDAVKLQNPEMQQALAGVPLYYLPVEVYFLVGGPEFDELVKQYISRTLAENSEPRLEGAV